LKLKWDLNALILLSFLGYDVFSEIPLISTRCLPVAYPTMTKITKRVVDAVRPSGKEAFLWDDETPGFGLRVKLTGAKSFIIQYRNAQGRSRSLTLGRYGVLTVEEARRRARLSLAAVLKGEDPAENKLLERGALTVADLCREYLSKAERGLILTKRGDTKKASTLYTDRGRIERHIIPLIGKRTVKELTTADVRKFVQDVIAGKKGRRGADPQAQARNRSRRSRGSGPYKGLAGRHSLLRCA
jgi:hypothetical protein